MRPQRSTAAAIAAPSVASRVTSAWKATHSPPDFAASAAVSSAEASSRSTARIFAPSCAKRSTVARPLPIPSPGLCPAPTMTAILPARRIISVLAGSTEQQDYTRSRRYWVSRMTNRCAWRHCELALLPHSDAGTGAYVLTGKLRLAQQARTPLQKRSEEEAFVGAGIGGLDCSLA